jgi:hypothetical protein
MTTKLCRYSEALVWGASSKTPKYAFSSVSTIHYDIQAAQITYKIGLSQTYHTAVPKQSVQGTRHKYSSREIGDGMK